MAKNIYTLLGIYFFIIGALLSVLDSTFPLATNLLPGIDTHGLIYVVLIFTGIFAGILNITEDEEHHFLVSAATFLLIIIAFTQIFASEPVINAFSNFFRNSVAFIGSMALVVALKTVLEFGSDNYRVTPLENMKIRTKHLEELTVTVGLRRWHFVIFLAVALTFLLILFEVFFRLPQFDGLIIGLNWLITLIFVVDLFVLFRQEKTWGRFFRNCWLDILASIPFSGVLGVFKIVRLSRIVKVTKSFKFFSQDSGVGEYLERGRVRDDPVVVQEHPTPRRSKKR